MTTLVELKSAATAAGIKQSAISDLELYAERFDPAAETTEAYIERVRESRPHWWNDGGVSRDAEKDLLADQAWGAKPNLTRQGEFVRRFGEEAAIEAATKRGGKLGSTAIKKVGDRKNPWLGGANWNLTEQGRIMRLDPKMADGLMRAAGVKLGATKPAA
jgi:hypothetical protein